MKFKKNWKRFWTLDLHHAEGFTLVELIVVIAILAILGGVAVPAYSGYIEKANVAADEVLLSSLNTAFASACSFEGVDMGSISPELSWDGQKVIGVEAGVADDVKALFNEFYDGEGSEFQVYTSADIEYSAAKNMFVVEELQEYTITMSDGSTVTVKLSQADIDKLADSTYITAEGLGAGGLLAKVDSVVGFGMSMVMKEDGTLSAFGELLNTEEYRSNLANSLGFTLPDDQDAFDEKMLELSGGDAETAQKILVNNAVLYAAQNTASKDELMSILKSENPKSAITEAMGGDSGYGLAQASAAYGLYTAYVYSLDDDYVDPVTKETKAQMIKNTENPINILNGLNNAGFQSYLNNEDGSGQAEKDLDAYLASMNMINDSAKDPDAVASVLVNGFADGGLVGLLTQTTTK